jgi:hypothetical protein
MTANLRPASPADEGEVHLTATTFLSSLTRRSYEPRMAWELLDPWYKLMNGWSSVADFASSDAGGPRILRRLDISDRAFMLSATPRANRHFVAARSGVSGCAREDQGALVASMWYVTLVPRGGISPAYLVVVGRPSGFRILHVD